MELNRKNRSTRTESKMKSQPLRSSGTLTQIEVDLGQIHLDHAASRWAVSWGTTSYFGQRLDLSNTASKLTCGWPYVLLCRPWSISSSTAANGQTNGQFRFSFASSLMVNRFVSIISQFPIIIHYYCIHLYAWKWAVDHEKPRFQKHDVHSFWFAEIRTQVLQIWRNIKITGKVYTS